MLGGLPAAQRRALRAAAHRDHTRPGPVAARMLGAVTCHLAVPGSGGEYGGMARVTVRRVDFGYFIRPAQETGTGVPRVEPCLGYAVSHPEGMILFDTG